MEIFQARDLLRYKTLTLEVPENITFAFKQRILLKGAREKVVAEVIGMPRTLPGAKVDEDFKFEKTLTDTELKKYDTLQEGEAERLQTVQAAADKLKLDM